MQIDDFKSAVGKFPTGVTIVTTNHQEQPYGFTANSFTSVSLDPQLISFCLNKKSASFSAFSNATYFAINILSNQQAELSKKFSQSNIDKFSNIQYEVSQFSDLPLLQDTIAFLECKKYQQIDCGDHDIFIGKVLTASIDKTKSPLLYYAKSYREIK